MSWQTHLARFYDLDMQDQDEDVGMYLALAKDVEGPILELAAGSGRVAIPLALAGHRVVGVDIDGAMRRRARSAWRERRGSLPGRSFRIVEGDLTLYRSGEPFGLVILSANGLLIMPDDDARLAALITMRANLRHDGQAVVDVSVPGEDELATWDGRLQLEWVRRDPRNGDWVTKSMSARHDPATGSVALTQVFDWAPAGRTSWRRVVRTDTLWLVTAEKVADLAARAGLEVLEGWGDHRFSPRGAGSPRAIMRMRLL
jgi:SAM-dependent methyltransferase